MLPPKVHKLKTISETSIDFCTNIPHNTYHTILLQTVTGNCGVSLKNKC